MESTGPKAELATNDQAMEKQNQTWLTQGKKEEAVYSGGRTSQQYSGQGCSFLRTVVLILEPALQSSERLAFFFFFFFYIFEVFSITVYV